MKAQRAVAVGVAAMAILEVVLSRFIRLLKGELIIDFLARIGGLNDISLMGLVNIAFVALSSFFKRVRFQPRTGSGPRSDSHIGNRSTFLHSSHTTTVDPNQKNQKQAA
jgi:hypothetical protein